MSGFTHIRTSKENHARVVELTRKFGFGAENVAARVALATSLASGKHMDLANIQNSSGKEYRSTVLFGRHTDAYIGIIAVKYNLHRTDKDIPKFIKMHIDHGIEDLHNLLQHSASPDPFDHLALVVATGMNLIE